MTTAASPILLHAERLTAGYGKMAILHDVTLDVRVGEMVSVIGPNGAGKSTAFKTIVGFLRPTSGRVWRQGRVAPLLEANLRLAERVRRRGGTRYAGYGAVPFTPADWANHYGPRPGRG